jgi:hypothetical protein
VLRAFIAVRSFLVGSPDHQKSTNADTVNGAT